MPKVIDLNEIDEKDRFPLKLQLALRINAISIKAESRHPERFDEYIREREEIIRKMVGIQGDLKIVEGDRTLFP